MDTEWEYYHFLADGSVSEFVTRLNANSKMAKEEGEMLNVFQDEAYLHYQVQNL